MKVLSQFDVPGPPVLMASHAILQADSPERLSHELQRAYRARIVRVDAADAPSLLGVGNRVAPGDVTLHYCRYDADVTIDFPNMGGYRQIFRLSGRGQIEVDGRTFALDDVASVILPPGSSFRSTYLAGYSHLVVQVDETRLARTSEQISGRDREDAFQLPTLQALETARLQRLKAATLALALQFSSAGEANPLVVSQLEQVILTAFLLENQGGFADLLSVQPRPAGRTSVDRLADFIRANWDKPLTAEDIAEACGVSVRSVFAGFKAQLGVTPMAYLRDVRLEQARAQLREGTASVIDIAMRCGFSSFGHFARRYREKFGELPSETLRGPR